MTTSFVRVNVVDVICGVRMWRRRLMRGEYDDVVCEGERGRCNLWVSNVATSPEFTFYCFLINKEFLDFIFEQLLLQSNTPALSVFTPPVIRRYDTLKRVLCYFEEGYVVV